MPKILKDPIFLISLEVSNSWNKICTGETPLVLPSGFQRDPSQNALRDDHNPVVVTNSGISLWFGENASAGKHSDASNIPKTERAKYALMACARAEMNGREIRVITSHWDSDQFPAMKAALLGEYNFTRNGEPFRFSVVDVIVIPEGFGTYHLHESKGEVIKECIVVEVGYGTVEYLCIKSGQLVDGWTSDEFAIKNLCDRVGSNHLLKVKNKSTTPNLEMINRDLRKPTHGRLSESEWSTLKNQYSRDFLTEFANSLDYELAQYSAVEKIILTGGGAALFGDVMGEGFKAEYGILPNAQTASLEGAYIWGLKQGF